MDTLLVANRGEIARRIFRTARAMGIGTAAVFSDADAEQPFVREADHAVRLPGNAPGDTYLRGDLIVAAARRAGADAIHPGYGFLSENAGFAREVEAAGLTWVGPPPDAIETMASKLAAKELMHDAGVPTLPWTTDQSAAAEIGFPLLVKASAGGGGRGMRVVRTLAELPDAIEVAEREAASAFGDGTVFVERYLESSRHIEIQIFADHHGHVVSLFERECSIQRRHQKIIEESPSPAVNSALRAAMGEAAIAAARAVGYVGAGTVEFVLTPDGSYYFLEMNTRLQVEHPVTECVAGLDLVRLQLLVAAGQPLPEAALQPGLNGHAIEVRLYAEDAENGFLPVAGVLRRFEVPDRVRCDSGVESGSVVSPYYDAMIAKVIAHASTRDEAAAKLATAMAAAKIHGLTTNRDLLVRILREPDFLAGATDTGYLDRHDPAELGRPLLTRADETAHLVAATLALSTWRRLGAVVQPGVPSGWRNNPSQPQQTRFQDRERERIVNYQVGRSGELTISVDGEPVELLLATSHPTSVVAEIDGVRRGFDIDIAADGVTVDVDSVFGSSSYIVVPRFAEPEESAAAGSLVAPMPGSVVRVLIEVGAEVTSGQKLIALEAMKMEHTVTSPADGVVTELRVAAGDHVEAGAVLAVVAAPPD